VCERKPKRPSSEVISAQSVTRYIDLLVGLLLVRRLRPFHGNIGKRVVKSPKVYVRDSGIVHALLGVGDYNSLAGHPVIGASWEGFVIENLLASAPPSSLPSFYRTAAGAEIDLMLEIAGQGTWAFDVKYGLSAQPEKGFHAACSDLNPDSRFMIYSGTERYRLGSKIEAIGLPEMASILSAF
jgi:hypothetical protein